MNKEEALTLKKKYKMENLGCANCAAKMEAGINKIPGVESCHINFMMQKMILEVKEDIPLQEVLQRAQKVVSDFESDCRIIE